MTWSSSRKTPITGRVPGWDRRASYEMDVIIG